MALKNISNHYWLSIDVTFYPIIRNNYFDESFTYLSDSDMQCEMVRHIL